MAESLPVASWVDTGRAVRDVLLPIVAQGAILRRPSMTRLSDRLEVDDRALRRFRALRAKYGEGPLLLRVPGRTMALVLNPAHVHRLLAETPEPFSAATSEKVGALRHFQPHAVLASDPPLRIPRRSLNEQALDTNRPVHRYGATMAAVVRDELDGLDGLTLGYFDFRERWNRITRRIVLGDKAAEDTELTGLLDSLRSNANWAQAHPRDRAGQVRLQTLIEAYVANAASGSLVGALAEAAGGSPGVDVDPDGTSTAAARQSGPTDVGSIDQLTAADQQSGPTDAGSIDQLAAVDRQSGRAGTRSTDQLDAAGQVPHWLFAFDSVGIALWRLLAVVAARPEVAERIAEEAGHPAESPLLAYTGAAMQESVRLWPTTPVILRQSRSETWWNGRAAPAGTEFAIVVPAFHRDDQALEFAHRLEPEVWIDGRADGEWPLVPFSAGPAVCPGRNVVLLTTSTAVSWLVSEYALDLDPVTRKKLRAESLPATFDHTTPRLGFWRRTRE